MKLAVWFNRTIEMSNRNMHDTTQVYQKIKLQPHQEKNKTT